MTDPTPNRVFEFWLGRAGSGKTHACVESIAAELRAQPRGPYLLFLVPEQASAQMEQALASQPGIGAFTRARVVTFRWLEREIFKAVGGAPRRVIDEGARVMLLRQILRRRRASLSAFGQAADLPGIAEAAGQAIVELRRYGWSLADLEAERDALRVEAESIGGGDGLLESKLRDLATLWRDYDAALIERGLDDDSLLASAAADRASDWPALDGARVWIDGFASFTAQEARLIDALLARASWGALALCLDPADQAFAQMRRALGEPLPGEPADLHTRRAGRERAFENVEHTFHSIRARLRDRGWRIDERFFPDPGRPTRFSASIALAHMESSALTRLYPLPMEDAAWRSERDANAAWPRGPIELAAAETRRDEVLAAARRIVALCAPPPAGRGYAWSDSAVIVRDLAPYAPLVREIFPRFGIPFFIDEKRVVAAHPLARLLLSALEICARGWRPDLAVAHLKSGLAAIPDLDSAARIERLARERRLDAAGLFDRARWSVGAREGAEKARCEALHDLWLAAARPIHALRSRLDSAGADPALALWEFLQAVDAPKKINGWMAEARSRGDQETAMLHSEAWKETVALLERLRLVGVTRLETGACDAQELLETVEAGLGAIRARLIPPTLDQVLVGSVERTRTPDIKAVFVLGLVEGEFPKVYSEDPIFGDRERARLALSGRELGPDSRRKFAQERFLAYIALTRASQYLFASFPARGSSEGAIGPSSFFRALAEEAFPMAFSDETPAGPPSLLPEEWAARLAAAFHAAVAGENPAPLAGALGGLPPLVRAELSDPSCAPARESARMVLESLRAPAQPSLDPALARDSLRAAGRLAATSLEHYAACPFKYFVSRVLRLEPLRDPTPGAQELGSFRHAILDGLFRRLAGDRGFVRWGEVDLARADRAIEDLARGEIERAESGLGRDPVSQSIVELAIEDLKSFVVAMRAMGARYGFVQAQAEMRFGAGGDDALQLEAAPGLLVRLKGSADRVDRLDEERLGASCGPLPLVVFDYKSSPRKIDASRLLAGLDLQLPAYALAVERAWRDPRGVRVVGAFYWPTRIGHDDAKGETEAWSEPGSEAWFKTRQLEGIFEDSSASRLDTRGGPGAKALAFKASWNNDGKLASNTSGWLSPKSMRALLEASREKMESLAKGIAGGAIDARPCVFKRKPVCDDCDFRGVCRVGEFGPEAMRPVKSVRFAALRGLGQEPSHDG